MITDLTTSLDHLLDRLDGILDRAERMLTTRDTSAGTDDADLAAAIAFTWTRRDGAGRFRPVRHVDTMRLADLVGIDRQLEKLVRNTRQFLAGLPANHVLLWGDRGTGKSSAVKALLHEFSGEGLRVVQVHRGDLLDLPEMLDRLWDRPEKYLLFCDDLSFETEDTAYKELKALLEGGIAARPRNVLVYATSNRRHLMPERMRDREPVLEGDEVHPNEALQEQLSLADRFGLRLGFYKMEQDTYLAVVRQLIAVRNLPADPHTVQGEALRWALSYSGVSGRSARQFVDDLEGRVRLDARGSEQ